MAGDMSFPLSGPFGVISSDTYANIIADPAPRVNTVAIATDVGPDGALMRYSSAGKWVIAGQGCLGTFAVPIVMPPSYTVDDAVGSITFGTAIPNFSGVSAWVYYSANSITASNAAGFYWTIFSSTTAAVVYQNTYTPAAGTVPSNVSSPTAWSTSVAGPYAGTTATVTYFIPPTLPANVLANGKSILSKIRLNVINNANTHNPAITLGGQTISSGSIASVLSLYATHTAQANANLAGLNCGSNWIGPTSAANSIRFTALDLTAAQALNYTMNKTTATDYMVVCGLNVTLEN